jgi:hypothetical protein
MCASVCVCVCVASLWKILPTEILLRVIANTRELFESPGPGVA